MVYYTIDSIAYHTLGFEAGEKYSSQMLLEWKISVCSQSSQFTSKKVKFSEDFLKRVNPYNLSDK